MKNELKQTELKKVMDYNADTGEFYWKFSKSGASIKKEAGCIDNSTGCRFVLIRFSFIQIHNNNDCYYTLSDINNNSH
jgi:hypothetical protein